ncbi:hypothetical protein OESDEN_05208 [Oesophagostomum dentatum]|uniref:Uncharacterized protein n=1 Tax=Oesophagostomum dentatum TaxID=61180 RepID=A0A0B1TG98_OESDE|nr:hypothetical protein OESDEN_05208 [Oesophagostomum dentatum]
MENLCKWPMLPDMSMDSLSSIIRPRNIRCETTMEPFAFLDEYGVLQLSPSIMGSDPLNETNIKCSYRPLRARGIEGYVLGEATTVIFDLCSPSATTEIINEPLHINRSNSINRRKYTTTSLLCSAIGTQHR